MIHNPFEVNESDVQQVQLEPISVEIDEEKKYIIQKEIIQTGSVSCFLQRYYYISILIG